jgi:hypothetical protein
MRSMPYAELGGPGSSPDQPSEITMIMRGRIRLLCEINPINDSHNPLNQVLTAVTYGGPVSLEVNALALLHSCCNNFLNLGTMKYTTNADIMAC